MSQTVIKKFQTERDEVIAQAEAIMERDDFDPKDEAYLALKERASTLNDTLSSLSEFQGQKAAADALDVALGQASQATPERRSSVNSELTSPGEFFVRSAEWQQHAQSGFMGKSRPVEVKDFLQTRATHVTSDFDLPAARREVEWSLSQTPIMGSLSIIPVSTGSVDVVTYQFTDLAAVVAEGSPKPESGLAQTVTNVNLDTIAHYVDVSRQLLADGAAVARKVDQALRRGVLEKLESEAEAVIHAGSYPNVVNADMLAAVREAIAELQATGYRPSTLYLNPADWAALDVSVQGSRTDGATGVLQTRYWGLNVVPSPGQVAGGAMVADAQAAFEAYRRQAVQVLTTDSDGSKFLSNIVTILAEARQRTVVVNPDAVRTTSAA